MYRLSSSLLLWIAVIVDVDGDTEVKIRPNKIPHLRSRAGNETLRSLCTVCV